MYVGPGRVAGEVGPAQRSRRVVVLEVRLREKERAWETRTAGANCALRSRAQEAVTRGDTPSSGYPFLAHTQHGESYFWPIGFRFAVRPEELTLRARVARAHPRPSRARLRNDSNQLPDRNLVHVSTQECRGRLKAATRDA